MSLNERLVQVRRSRQASDQPPTADPASATRHRDGPAPDDPHRTLKLTVHASLVNSLGPRLYDSAVSEEDLARLVHVELHAVLTREGTPLSVADKAALTQQIADNILGYGPLEPFLRDGEVSEIMVNGPSVIYVERSGSLHRVTAAFADDAHLRRTIDKIVAGVGRRVDEASPMVDARLPDGSRINAVVPPLAVDGASLTIRKFAADPYTVDDLVAFGTMTAGVAQFLRHCVQGRMCILVSGGTGAGKTTTLNTLSSFIPEAERIVTIEDSAELQLHQQHVVRLESRPANAEGRGEVTIRDLVRNSLRMRPDRIVVGEVRDAAALDMLQAMNTGHDGSICTVHAKGPRDALSRIETMVLMSGIELPVRAIREQLASAIDVVVHQARLRDGSRRITHVTEVAGMEGDILTLKDLFVLDQGTLRATGLIPDFLPRLSENDIAVNRAVFDATPDLSTGART
ncbi:MAG: CpaF family protein [Actinomycetes bacterium]